MTLPNHRIVLTILTFCLLFVLSSCYVYDTQGTAIFNSAKVRALATAADDVINKAHLDSAVDEMTALLTDLRSSIDELSMRVDRMYVIARRYVAPGNDFVVELPETSEYVHVFATVKQADAGSSPLQAAVYGRNASSVHVWICDWQDANPAVGAEEVYVFFFYTNTNSYSDFHAGAYGTTGANTTPALKAVPTVFVEGDMAVKGIDQPMDCRLDFTPTASSFISRCYTEESLKPSSKTNVPYSVVALTPSVFDATKVQYGVVQTGLRSGGLTFQKSVTFATVFSLIPVVHITVQEANNGGPSVCSVTTVTTEGFTFICRWKTTADSENYAWIAAIPDLKVAATY